MPATNRRTSVARCLPLAALLVAACSADEQPSAPPAVDPHRELRTSAFVVDIDLRAGTIRVSEPPPSASADPRAVSARLSPGTATPAFSLVSGDAVAIVGSQLTTSTVQERKIARFTLAVTNRLSNTELATPTWPAPPTGVSGVLLLPLAVYSPTGSLISGAIPTADWNGDGSRGSGAPHNFFNDFGCPAGSTDCLRWIAFAAPLPAGTATADRTVGFSLPLSVTQFQAVMLVAADLRDVPVGGTIAGTVMSPELGPLAGAEVRAAGATTITDGAGGFAIAPVPVGPAAVSVALLPPGCVDPGIQLLTVASKQVSKARFTVHCSGVVSGTVRTANAPLSGVSVSVGGKSTVTGPLGTYALSGIAAGAQEVVIGGPVPTGCRIPSPVAVIVPTGGSATAGFVVSCFGSLSVETGDDVGVPVAGASLTLTDGSATVLASASSDASGRASFPIVPAGAFTITASVVGTPPRCVPTSASGQISSGASSNVVLKVVCHGGIDGRAIDNAAAPIAGATLTATRGPFALSAATGATGVASLFLPSADYGLTWVADGCDAAAIPLIHIAPGVTFSKTQPLTCYGSITGTIDSRLGGPLAGVTVTGGSSSAITAADGTYRIDRALIGTGLPVVVSNMGPYCTGPHNAGNVTVTRSGVVTRNADPTCLGGVLRVQTHFKFGSSPTVIATGISVLLMNGSGIVAGASSDAFGIATLPAMRPGLYFLVFPEAPPGCTVPPPTPRVILNGDNYSLSGLHIHC